MDAVMEVEQVDGVVAEIGHRGDLERFATIDNLCGCVISPMPDRRSARVLANDHPRHAELVGQHAELDGEERLVV
jgi:hypothetical protein